MRHRGQRIIPMLFRCGRWHHWYRCRCTDCFYLLLSSLTVKKRRSVLNSALQLSDLSPEAAKIARRKRTRYGKPIYALTITVLRVVVSSGIYNCSNVVDNFCLTGNGQVGDTARRDCCILGALGTVSAVI